MGKDRKIKILGGVVTYNPQIVRLKENLATLIDQVDVLYVFDNGSKNIKEIKETLRLYNYKIVVHEEKSNVGIALALKNIMEYAKNNGYDWVLSVDQDSILTQDLVNKYRNVIVTHPMKNIGVLTCLIKDRNFQDESVEKQDKELKEVPICITSASLTNVNNYFLTSGYDSKLFIDLVDTDICLTFRDKGFKILRINYVGVYHEIGHGENKKLLWKKIIVHHSSVFREYYMARNAVILRKKHPNLYSKKTMLHGLILNFLIIIFFENNKLKRLSKYFLGIYKGIEY